MRKSDSKTAPPKVDKAEEALPTISNASLIPGLWNLKVGLRLKALLLVLLLVLASLGIMASVSWQFTSEAVLPLLKQHAEQSGRHLAEASALAFEHDDLTSLEQLTVAWLDDPSLDFVAIYDTQDRLLASAVRNQRTWEHLRRSSSQRPDASPPTSAAPNASPVDDPLTLVVRRDVRVKDAVADDAGDAPAAAAAPSDHESRLAGHVVVGVSKGAVEAARSHQRQLILTIIVGALGITLLIILPTVGRWAARLERLVEASNRLSRGELEQGVSDAGTDEIGLLAEAHEAMRQKIQRREEELRQLNASLQQRVIERTRDLAEAKDIAESANRAKNMFLTNMTHEIRTPMNGIVGVAEVLLNQAEDEHQQRLSGSIHNAATSLLQVIDDILDFSRIEAGQITLDIGPVQTADVAQQVVDQLTPRAQEKGSTLRLDLIHGESSTAEPPGTDGPDDIPDGATTITSDRHRVRQVLLGLVTNAIKLTRDSELELHVLSGLSSRRSGVVFRVLDRRHGIPNEALTLPSDPAHQGAEFGPSSDTPGLGLTLAYHLSKVLGGTLAFNDSTSHGTVLEVHLPSLDSRQLVPPSSPYSTGSLPTIPIPRFEIPAPSPEVRSAPRHDIATRQLETTSAGPRARILVAEDNRVNRMVVLGHLRALGFHAQAVENGRQALDLMAQEPFDLVLMDCQMPEIDGYEATRQLRRREQEQGDGRLPVIAVTAHAMRGDRDRCLASGMDDYLAKPFRSEQLVATLNRWLPNTAVPTEAPPSAPAAAPEPATDEAGIPRLDMAPLNDLIQLGRSMGQDVLGRVVGVFLNETPGFLADLRRAATNRDMSALRDTAHAVKGSAANIGAPRLSHQAESIESLAAQGAEVEWQDLLAALEEEYEAVSTALEQQVEAHQVR